MTSSELLSLLLWSCKKDASVRWFWRRRKLFHPGCFWILGRDCWSTCIRSGTGAWGRRARETSYGSCYRYSSLRVVNHCIGSQTFYLQYIIPLSMSIALTIIFRMHWPISSTLSFISFLQFNYTSALSELLAQSFLMFGLWDNITLVILTLVWMVTFDWHLLKVINSILDALTMDCYLFRVSLGDRCGHWVP